ncbi:MAG: helical backbone metal receptor [Candidatus Riflebacteria bacterium]|nr:helical backbone metal receptor [Candidatus Riflebacteria bacterium]
MITRNICRSILILFLTLAMILPVQAGANRIISLVPSQTELLFELGFGDQIVGVSDFCNFPPATGKIEKIGGLELSIEKLVALQPTLLVDANSMHKKYEPLFQQLGLNYANFSTTRLEHLPVVACELAKLLKDPGKGILFSEAWNSRLRKLDLKKPEKGLLVYFEIWDTPMQAAGQSSFIGELISRSGGINICKDQTDFPLVNSESVINANPDVIFVAYPLPNLKNIKNRAGWASLKAVKNNLVFSLDQDLFVRPGPRNLEALELLNEIFHQVQTP